MLASEVGLYGVQVAACGFANERTFCERNPDGARPFIRETASGVCGRSHQSIGFDLTATLKPSIALPVSSRVVMRAGRDFGVGRRWLLHH
jgi:hypothetical protein